MKRRTYLSGLAGLGAMSAVGVGNASATLSNHYQEVVVYDDPTGDNKGKGDLKLPTNSAFYPGVWDVDTLTIEQSSERVRLTFQMATEVQNPFDLDGGFSHEFFQIYVRDPDAGSDVTSDTSGRIGLNANFQEPYQYRIIVKGESKFSDSVEDPNQGVVSNDVNVTVEGKNFVIDVPRSAIGGDIGGKMIAPLVCPYDGFQQTGRDSEYLRGIGEQGGYTIGGSQGAPRVMDMITPEGTTQEDALTNNSLGPVKLPYTEVPATSGGGGSDDGGSDDGGSDDGGNNDGGSDSPPSVDPLPGQSNAPGSIDDDDLMEDVDGNGEGQVADVITYFNNRDEAAVTNNPAAFDFDGSGSAGNIGDVIALFNKIFG